METRGKKLVLLACSKKLSSQNIPKDVTTVTAAPLMTPTVTAPSQIPAPAALIESATAMLATPVLTPSVATFSDTELLVALVPPPAPAEFGLDLAVPNIDKNSQQQQPQGHSSSSSGSSSSSSEDSDNTNKSKLPQNSNEDAHNPGIPAPDSPSILYDRAKNTDSMGTDVNSINEPDDFSDIQNGDFSCTDTGDEYKPSSSSSSSDSSSSSSSSSSSDSDSEQRPVTDGENQEPESLPKTSSRKRTRNPTVWKKNIAKKLKNTGKQYKSIKTGKIVTAKTMGPPCNCSRLACSSKFTYDKRLEIFTAFWELGSVEKHRDFLNSCMRPLKIVSRRVVAGRNTRPRHENTGFYLLNNGKEFQVCKLFLMNTLAITQRTIRTVIDAKHKNDGIIPVDKRGKHGKQCKLDIETRKSIKDHIESIPTIESHYLRASTSRLFIDGGLTIAEMHRNYTEKQKENNAPAANYDAYSRIFNHEYNIGFFKPKKDQCDECESYKNAPEEQKPNLYASYKLHLEEKSLSRLAKEKDMKECQESGSNSIVVTYDLQAVMPCPVGNSSAFFYKSRLNCYNFTMSDGRNHETTCFFWHEGIGNRGAIDIGSCVYNFLESLANTNPGCDVIFYSDNCCGQHKNKFVFAMYFYAVTKLAINSIQHNFLIRGHTQNEGDAAHSVIEKAITRAKKSGPIYVPDQYISLIRGAKKTGKPFVVKEMNYTDFFDLKEMTVLMNFNMAKNINGDAIKVTDIKSIKFTKNCDTYQYRTTFKTVNWYEARTITETRGRRARSDAQNTTDITDITLKPAYTSKIPIAERKRRDLLHLVETNIVPRYYEQFFRDL